MRYADLENIEDASRKARTATFKRLAGLFRERKTSKSMRQRICQQLDCDLILRMKYKDTADFWERTKGMFTDHVTPWLEKQKTT